MPIVDATAIGLLYVAFVIPLGLPVLKERFHRRHLGAMAMCCAGAMVIMASRGAFPEFHADYVFPAVIAILGAALLAFEGLMIKMLSLADRAMTVLLHINAFGILPMAVPAAMQWLPLSSASVICFVLLGPLAVAARYCIVQGCRDASLSIVGPVDYTWLIFAGLIGFLFFGQRPTWGVVAGSALIAVGGIMLAVVVPPSGECGTTSPA